MLLQHDTSADFPAADVLASERRATALAAASKVLAATSCIEPRVAPL